MSDYRVRISVRNARLLRAIERAGHRPGAQFAAAVGISYSGALLPYLNLTRSPLTPDGLLRECAWNLCDFLNSSPSDLWSDAQLNPLRKNHSSIDLDADSVQALVCGSIATDPLRLASHAQAGRILQDALDSLTPRESSVIRERFFGDASLEELAEKMDMTRTRVHQIEVKALRKLRSDKTIRGQLDGSADVIGGAADA
ncbi:sigma-70 family RNA polymerase sigma factor [Pseudomonas aeruginosa]|uniref:sigma-70 family RNA polymerase sigma factor n=1 Tax=Pseudomonas aeruginosa TaxID=287 RepID=UPI002043DE91|nr:sigma-70 family RNA polymerase sigma factor [Pseudomonas aeruginosa]MCM3889422.1 sigma-70 family RNA polymerase sigma factor [Pseudomonas aeruginosa]MCM3940159.1 sigma-70 family RNA polymerase sigma factor [Pseudomonas aeruginosa]MCM3951035.1 sigma-70 family RNA polymerase sigma factor [Pseudomonas aeruginosa]MCM3958286.1 sigma-70 family RNA polymerase sigma factor [Pseudomonas aeruginosa]MCM3964404.1 sigma-70 family RNA polymerase sigma factor [Pseudomonas aeruginosa]